MNNIRLLVSDIDGTLVRHDKTLSETVVTAIARARAAGLMISLISARPPQGMLWIAERLELTGPIGAFNGSTLVQPDGTIVSAEHLAPHIAEQALASLHQPDVTPWLFADGSWYAKTTQDSKVAREKLAANQDPVIRDDFSSLLDRADKIVGVSDDYDLLATLEARLSAKLGQAATVVRSQPYYLDITSAGGNKGDGLSALAAAYGVSPGEVAVIGDQNNDLAMFERAGYSFAMGQAPENVRAAATDVTASNEEDGVADAIDRLILPKVCAV